jgi:hypothetical protein
VTFRTITLSIPAIRWEMEINVGCRNNHGPRHAMRHSCRVTANGQLPRKRLRNAHYRRQIVKTALAVLGFAAVLPFAAPAHADRNPDPDRPCHGKAAISPNGNGAACTACQQKYSNLPDQQTIGWLCGQDGGVAPKFTNMPCYVFYRSENRVEYTHTPDCEGIEIV